MNVAPGNTTMKRLSQALGILAMAFLLGMIAHKGHADISVLAGKYSGSEFWVQVASYFIANLAGGANPASK
jgi:hypothetical protein